MGRTGTPRRTVVSAWHGTYLLEGDRTVREALAPADAALLADRARLRASGRPTPEDEAILTARGGETWGTRDRRLVGPGVVFERDGPGVVEPTPDRRLHRLAILAEAERALAASWDPSVHVEEAVRALRDVERAANLVGERLTSWAARDAPDLDPTDPIRAARAVLAATGSAAFAPDNPKLSEARKRLAELVTSLREVRQGLEEAVASAVPTSTPNLHRLLGADLAARLVAQAGGLSRLARLPSSTVQVLGAERAFFEHLRGKAPPPRHGLLFLHPSIQSAPRSQRGKLARALAGKASIAARLDRAGSPIDPGLREAFERRRDAIRAARTTGPTRSRGRRSRAPFDAAAEHRPLRR